MDIEQVFSTQSNLLREVATIISSRIQELEHDSVNATISETVIPIFKARSLNVYKRALLYLANEIENPTSQHAFLLPHVRTLLDTYGRFLHLACNCKDQDEQVIVCLAYQLCTLKKLKGEYQIVYNLYKDYFVARNIDFPENPEALHWSWLKNNGYTFPKSSKLLTKENISNHSIETMKIFRADKTHTIYGFFSEFIHGNPYYSNDPHNERFWVAAMATMNAAFFIELVDRYTFHKLNRRDFRILLKKLGADGSAFRRIWVEESKKLSTRNSSSSFAIQSK